MLFGILPHIFSIKVGGKVLETLILKHSLSSINREIMIFSMEHLVILKIKTLFTVTIKLYFQVLIIPLFK
jgi:hypothetical protein